LDVLAANLRWPTVVFESDCEIFVKAISHKICPLLYCMVDFRCGRGEILPWFRRYNTINEVIMSICHYEDKYIAGKFAMMLWVL
jgi:hypothetical protein